MGAAFLGEHNRKKTSVSHKCDIFACVPRHHLGPGHVGRVPHQPQEVHPRHQDGLRRTQEEEGAGPAHRLPAGRHGKVKKRWCRQKNEKGKKGAGQVPLRGTPLEKSSTTSTFRLNLT